MSNNQTQLIAYAAIALIVGAAIGYYVAGTMSTVPGDVAELQAQLTAARSQITTLENDVETLEAQIQELSNPTLSGTISIAGSTTVLPISQECANLFMSDHPEVQISVAGGGSGAGIKSGGSGEVDIGEASRNIKDTEFLSYPDLVPFAIAKDSVAIIVNPQNPLANSLDITMEQAKQIFAGEITNWSQLGGEDHEIEVFTREEGSGTREVFTTYIMGSEEFAATAGVKPSNGEMRAAVASNRYAVAYISLGYVDSSVKTAKIGGAEATVDNVLNGQYPITRILWMFTKGMPSELEAAFIEFVQGSEGQGVVKDLGYIPIY